MSQFRRQTVTFCSHFYCKTFQEKCLVNCDDFLNENKVLSLDNINLTFYDRTKDVYDSKESIKYDNL